MGDSIRSVTILVNMARQELDMTESLLAAAPPQKSGDEWTASVESSLREIVSRFSDIHEAYVKHRRARTWGGSV